MTVSSYKAEDAFPEPAGAVLFDLDGVLVSTDEFHYQAWKALAERLDVAFGRAENEALRGVSRMESLHLMLGAAASRYSDSELVELAEWKNNHYRGLLENLSPDDVLPGVESALAVLGERGYRVAVASSSRNAGTIMEKTGLTGRFQAIVDGNDINESKPHPEVFLKAAAAVSVSPEDCLVVEDAEAGVTAGLAAGMKVLAVGSASADPRANYSARDLREVNWEDLLSQE